MKKAGFNFIAVTDIKPGTFIHKDYEPYCQMYALDCHQALVKYGNEANVLLTCWPANHSYNSDMEILFFGEYIVHIGEPDGGCTYFGEVNSNEWDLIEVIKTPHWNCMNDRMEIYKRKQKSVCILF